MSATGSWNYNLRSLVQLIRPQRFFCGIVSREQNPASSQAAKLESCYFARYQGLQYLTSASVLAWRKPDTNMVKDDRVRPPSPSPPAPPGPPRWNFPSWTKWVLGSLLTLVLPFWKQKWEQLKMIEGEAEIVVQGAEKIAEMVEEVATTAEKVSEEVVENHPQDDKLKEAAIFVERVSKATAHDALVTKEFFQKVDALEHDLDNLENMVEPVIKKWLPQKSDPK